MSDAATMVRSRAGQDPLGAVISPSGGERAPRLLAAAVNQNVFRQLLHGYLHEPAGGHWFRHAATACGRDWRFPELMGAVLPALDGVSPQEAAALSREPGAAGMADWIVRLYALYRRVLPPGEGDVQTAPEPRAGLDCPLPRSVRRLAPEFEGAAGLSLFLHGSLATCDATPYSDVDTLLVVSHRWLESAASLGELRERVQRAARWLYVQDPTQHHGFMVVTELDLARYARHYFPLELLAHAYALVPGAPPRYRLRRSEDESWWLLHGMARRLARLESGEEAAPRTRYALKTVLSEAMLLPSYYLQLCGQVLYKRDSFAAVRGLLSRGAAGAMDELSAWRREWRRSAWDDAYRRLGGAAPEYVRTRLLARVRACPLSAAEVGRWHALLPGLRALADELALAAEARA